MATIDTNARLQPEAVHVGLNVAICRISLSATISAGDIHRIGKLPHGAIPVDAIFYQGSAFTNVSTGHVAKFGTSASQEMFFASATFSTGTPMSRTTRVLGTARQVSLLDDAMPRWENIVMVATGMSIGHMGDLIVFYKLPGQTL